MAEGILFIRDAENISMKTRNWMILLALAFTTVYAACDNKNDDQVTPSTLTQTDIDHLNKITQGNLAEIAWSKIAQDSGTNSRMVQFAQQMISDHQQAQTQVDSLAKAYNVELPQDLDTTNTRFRDSLKAQLKGRRFDTLFMGQQVRLHELMINNLNATNTNAKNNDVKNLASRLLPNVMKHRDTAVVIKNQL